MHRRIRYTLTNKRQAAATLEIAESAVGPHSRRRGDPRPRRVRLAAPKMPESERRPGAVDSGCPRICQSEPETLHPASGHHGAWPVLWLIVSVPPPRKMERASRRQLSRDAHPSGAFAVSMPHVHEPVHAGSYLVSTAMSACQPKPLHRPTVPQGLASAGTRRTRLQEAQRAPG